MMWMALIIVGVHLMPSNAIAQDADRYYPPAGCFGVLTTQNRGCVVNNIYKCEQDNPGESWRVMFDREGPTFFSKIDYQAQWLESYDPFSEEPDVLRLPAVDPANLTELFNSGIDTFDFVQTSGQKMTRIVGFDQLTGTDVIIDGEQLLGTEYNVRYQSTVDQDLNVNGYEYVSVKHRRFFSGIATLTQGDDVEDRDHTPIKFIYPGEPGFFTKTPLYECEASLAQYAPIQEGFNR